MNSGCAGLCRTVFDYQTLIAGILAVVAGGITILLTVSSERRSLRRQSDAARATMPLVLAGLSDWSEAVARELRETLATARFNLAEDESEYLKRGNFPPVSSDHVTELRTIVAATRNETVRRRISVTLGNDQVLQSRLKGMADPNLTIVPDNLAAHLVKAATIEAEISSMFDFARFRSEIVEAVTWKSVREILVLWGCDGPGFDQLNSVLGGLEASGRAPEDPAF